MELGNQNKAKKGLRVKKLNSTGCGSGLNMNSNSNSNVLLITRLPDSRILHIVSRSFFLAIVLIALPIIGPFMSNCSNGMLYESGLDFDAAAVLEILPVILPDLIDEGLVRAGDKGLIVGSGMDEVRNDLIKLLTENNGIDLEIVSKLDGIRNGEFDFVLGLNLNCVKCVDGVVKANGIVIAQMKNEPSSSSSTLLLHLHPNYRIVYLRQFKDTIVAMRKARLKGGLTSSSSTGKMRLCGRKQEARKMALKGLEEAMLEPPRVPSRLNGREELKFLPDLMIGDSLEAYKRRMFIFISDDKIGGGGSGAEEWFKKNYPTRNQHFEVYKWDVGSSAAVGISDWLRRNIRKHDFVVMKAGEELVDEMMKDKTICLVDELFVECSYRRRRWPAYEGEETETETETETEAEAGTESKKRKRVYWQCLALYGDLRDEGVAVHQWWS